MIIENRFITYGYESAAYFCDRKSETQELVTMLTTGNNAALISHRRMGKKGKAKQILRMSFVKRHCLSSASRVQKSAQALSYFLHF